MHGTKNEPTWFSIQPPSPQDGMLGLENPLKSLLEHLALENYFCSKGYPCPLLQMKILLLSSATMQGNF
jgi:hypothetical protein